MKNNLESDPPGLPLLLTGRTSLFAIIGDPIAQVGSPGLFNSFFRQRHWQAVLVPLHIRASDLAGTLRGLRRICNLRGLVLTTPRKTAALELVDEIGPEAKLVRSINAVCCGDDGHWRGENFDGLGCVRGLRKAGLAVSGRSVRIVGTGGAGRAVATAIARKGPAQLMLHDLVRSLASRVCGDLRAAFAGLQAQSGEPDPRGYDIVINCTPIGMTCSPGLPFEITLLGPGTVVVDLVVEPEMTELSQAAAAKGCLVHPAGARSKARSRRYAHSSFEGVGHG